MSDPQTEPDRPVPAPDEPGTAGDDQTEEGEQIGQDETANEPTGT